MNQQLVGYRRDLHRIPETDFDLPETLAYLRQVLEQYDCQLITPCKSTLCAFFDAGKPKTTAFRADMDALPITERSEAEYASCHAGRMHACGHDGHMAMVLALAGVVSQNLHRLPRNVLLVFQPAEETTGGARLVCESGVFERFHCDRIIGWHLWPDLPAGVIASRPGPLLARSSEVTVTVTGRSSHIAKAQDGADALYAAAAFVCRAYEGIAKLGSPEELRLLKFGKLESGQARNAISPGSQLLGSLRVYSQQMFDEATAMMEQIARQLEQETGCTFALHFSQGYPPVCNDEALFALARQALPQMEQLPQPLLIAEDFSFYQQHLPGLFLLLGTGSGIPLHADTFDFDETVLEVGLAADEALLWLE
ncbi:amidohydrolase [uncultured Allofournierella sp.]|uniref:amidohydrolase n=1 Tax=uncultured Allofournierella sp. TaxID=1940258 RepID=UPI0037509CB1